MNDDQREKEALFRHSVLGPILCQPLKRGELKRTLKELASQYWMCRDGKVRQISAKTLEEWYYRHRREGFEGLQPHVRKDRGKLKALPEDLRELVLALKREDTGRSAPLIIEELVNAGRLKAGQVSCSTIQRLLRREGLSGPSLELDRPARYRWQATKCGELWQTDAVHGPQLFDPVAGRLVRVKVFALLDDRSRLVPYARAGFHETQADFLTVLFGAIQRRGAPWGIFADNHKSFTGTDTALACAKLSIRLHFARPYDGASKGKIERFWRTFRGRFLDRLDLTAVTTLDELNVRIATWIEDYNRRPHSSLSGRTPLEVWEEDAEAIRWVDDPAVLEAAFTATFEREVRNDSTCQVQGRTYEVPTRFRGRTVTIGYALLTQDRLWVQDGETRLPLREVDAEANARRRRTGEGPLPDKTPKTKTGFNSVEDLLKNVLAPRREEGGRDSA